MLDLKSAVRKHGPKYAGNPMDLVTLREFESKILSEILSEIPAEFTLRDLFELLREEKLVTEVVGGFVLVNLKNAQAANRSSALQ